MCGLLIVPLLDPDVLAVTEILVALPLKATLQVLVSFGIRIWFLLLITFLETIPQLGLQYRQVCFAVLKSAMFL